MGKAFIQLFILVVVFTGLWLGLSQVDFVKRFHMDNLGKKTEKRVGDAIMKSIKRSENIIDDDSTQHVLDLIRDKMVAGDSTLPTDIDLVLVESREINAFALPGDHIVIYTHLIENCDSVEELCGVLSHEMAHLKLNHVMKRLASEIGMGVLGSVAGGGNAGTVNQIIKMLSSRAFERKQEAEADEEGVRILQKSHIDPAAFAGFMAKIAELHKNDPQFLGWISTHPDSKERAMSIRRMAAAGPKGYEPVLKPEEWKLLQASAGQ